MENNIAFSVPGNFFCLFRIGDNIQANLETLNYFYGLYGTASYDDKVKLLKPIIIIEVSIIEAILHDFHLRMRANVIEGVTGIGAEVLNYIRDKKIDELEKYIASARKHDFFSEADSNFYEKLDELRIVRNRIHIQNAKFVRPLHEVHVFTEAAKLSAEKCLEKVVKTISQNYPRPQGLGDYVGDLVFPWDEHLD